MAHVDGYIGILVDSSGVMAGSGPGVPLAEHEAVEKMMPEAVRLKVRQDDMDNRALYRIDGTLETSPDRQVDVLA